MTPEEVEREANRLLSQYAPDWTFKWRGTKRTLAQCVHDEKTMYFSRAFARYGKDEDIKDTLLHEIAHILASPYAGHGEPWKRQAMALGARPETCFSGDSGIPALYVGRCPQCNAYYRIYRLVRHLKGRLCMKPQCYKNKVKVIWKKGTKD